MNNTLYLKLCRMLEENNRQEIMDAISDEIERNRIEAFDNGVKSVIQHDRFDGQD